MYLTRHYMERAESKQVAKEIGHQLQLHKPEDPSVIPGKVSNAVVHIYNL